MNNNRIIFIISISFTLLLNLPRIIFLLGNAENIDLIEISANDTFFRLFSLFTFSFLILKLNIDWGTKWFLKRASLKSYLLSVFVFIVFIGLHRVFSTINYGETSSLNHRLINYVYFFVMLMLLISSRTVILNNKSKIDAIEKEQLKQQSLENELSALKNQVNPHFLFNSLNTLILLVREDQKAAVKFINNLSFLYRYMLQSKDNDMVTVKEELKFLQSYVHLIKQRYRDNFDVSINISETVLQKKILTMTLQLLMENAVKHNEISDDKPLHVEVFDEYKCLIVKNKLQKRTGYVESTHIGLSNLNTRFKLHTNREIEILKDNLQFSVKIPIL